MSSAPTGERVRWGNQDHPALSRWSQVGRGADIKPALHQDTTIFGYAGADVFAGCIQQLVDWNDQNGPATGLHARIAGIIGTPDEKAGDEAERLGRAAHSRDRNEDGGP